MCVIIHARKHRPDLETLKLCEARNRDGGGIAWFESSDNKVHWEKGLDVKEVAALVCKVPLPFIVHFRIATVGGTAPILTHPFPITTESQLFRSGKATAVLFHNGHVEKAKLDFTAKALSLPTMPGVESDSRVIAQICSRVGHEWLDKLWGNVFAVMTEGKIFSYGTWTKIKGIHYSNDHWRNYGKTTTVSRSACGFNTGDYGDDFDHSYYRGTVPGGRRSQSRHQDAEGNTWERMAGGKFVKVYDAKSGSQAARQPASETTTTEADAAKDTVSAESGAVIVKLPNEDAKAAAKHGETNGEVMRPLFDYPEVIKLTASGLEHAFGCHCFNCCADALSTYYIHQANPPCQCRHCRKINAVRMAHWNDNDCSCIVCDGYKVFITREHPLGCACYQCRKVHKYAMEKRVYSILTVVRSASRMTAPVPPEPAPQVTPASGPDDSAQPESDETLTADMTGQAGMD